MPVRRRPGPFTGRGAVVCVLPLLALAGCGSGTIQIEAPDLSSADEAACASLVDDLPDTLAGEPRRPVDPDDALGAAWGDPAYVLTCGVPEPSDYAPTTECSVIKGVGWYVSDDQLGDLRVDATPVALSLTPYVEVLVPSRYRTNGIDRALADLAPVLEKHLAPGRPCL